ncbi:hypothetical protein J2Y45_006853 [Dyadobacter sp. BE34]|uniref:Uncharacterized protein n=1 Tax=Dyadobacter fermentans TaxID=94254 RepID=A0ABU1R8M7_9BACT|nr:MULTISPECIES: hypothetical protein [Dyadobacter]MDR6809766.1 hypothetical protein [Dyadobacter fermentans]MDR7047519.1 hypothetical protein [Dyadobacter sp. BE242]MDR7201689.1 hypothetical protein [Dyadobacter sp. BE34]MDR7219559.1 hypothetical protein [Dyadobacter sp. BE31]MDR7267318.1 hypothetical protein [Dyadobacter sp. BE32]
MQTTAFKSMHNCAVAFCVVFLALLTSCSNSSTTAPEPESPVQYRVNDISYFLGPNDRVDTAVLQLTGASLQNSTSMLKTQQVDIVLDQLTKTSQFTFDSTPFLPGKPDLAKLEVRVPQGFIKGKLFDYFPQTFPLTPSLQVKPYGSYENQSISVKIPPKSLILISHQIEGYEVICSFKAIIENLDTRQQYTLAGKWKGLLRYNNLSTSLRESTM